MAAVAIAGDPVLIAVAGGALLLCVVAHALGPSCPGVAAVAVGVTFNVLIRAEIHQFLGLSAIVGLASGAVVFVTGALAAADASTTVRMGSGRDGCTPGRRRRCGDRVRGVPRPP